MATETIVPSAGSTPPVNDTYIEGTAATTNFDAGATLALGVVIGKSGGGPDRILVEFTSALAAATWTITDATLTLTCYGAAAITAAATVYRLTQSFTEAGATYNTYDGTNNWPGGAGGGGDIDTTAGRTPNFTTPGATGALNIGGGAGDEMAALVQDCIDNRSGVIRLLLKLDNEAPSSGNYVASFYAGENITPGNRPTLTINYTAIGAAGFAYNQGIII